MKKTDIYQLLTITFREVFGDDKIEIKDTTSAADIDGWDSIQHINLILATEAAFNVTFTTAEIEKLSGVGQFVDLIAQKLPEIK